MGSSDATPLIKGIRVNAGLKQMDIFGMQKKGAIGAKFMAPLKVQPLQAIPEFKKKEPEMAPRFESPKEESKMP